MKIWMPLILTVLLMPSVGWAQPDPPLLIGPTYVTVGEEYYFGLNWTDANEEYYVDWGDETVSGWIRASILPICGRVLHCYSHIWISPGTYIVRAKIRYTSSPVESGWSDPLTITAQLPPSNIIGLLEYPSSGFISGLNPIYGWSIHPQSITKIELYIDDQLIGNIAYGGSRPDVKASFPDYPNAENSGFATVYDFSSLSQGIHVIKVRAYNQDGLFKDFTVSVNVVKFHGDFVSEMNPSQRWLRFNRVIADGTKKRYDILIQWDIESQGCRIIEIRKRGK